MQIDDFRSTVSTFADPGSELLFEKNRALIALDGDVIEISLAQKSGDVLVDDGSGLEPAAIWIQKRLAKLQLLATRLQETIPSTDTFVAPAGRLLPTLTDSPHEKPADTKDALATTRSTLDKRSPLETTVLYITSNAGEGKTCLINQLAREQAKLFSKKESDWLLVPIPLGGRHFLRFDDITVGVLQNRYRFSSLYYDSFLALVRMGVIVPAFDGFEEMFVENSSGEALSAMGLLVGTLQSKGAIVIAARKAYFEFENLKTQERLFDTIRSNSVGFSKLEISRWDREQFLAYCGKRHVNDPDKAYAKVSDRLGSDHSLLTRPVLVRRLVDVISESSTLEQLLNRIHTAGQDFFTVFVQGIVEREATEKWIDRSGERDLGTPLLSVAEHCDLLSQVALAMWESRVDYIKPDLLEFVADEFCEQTRKSSFQASQVRERICGHALLVMSPNAAGAVEFDHEEFRLFFLGEAIARSTTLPNEKAKAATLGALRREALPKRAQHAFVNAIRRNSSPSAQQVASLLLSVAALDNKSSYTSENCSSLIIRLLSDITPVGLCVSGMNFVSDILRDRNLVELKFLDCYFSPTSLETTKLRDCIFEKCRFSQLRVFDTTCLQNVSFDDCTVDALDFPDKDLVVWNPDHIRAHLQRLGVRFPGEEPISADIKIDMHATESQPRDARLRDVEKIVRYFMRSTHISESIMLIRLGNRGQCFIDVTLPELMIRGVFVEIEHRGGSDQRRFRLGVPLQKVNAAIAEAHGRYEHFLQQFTIT